MAAQRKQLWTIITTGGIVLLLTFNCSDSNDTPGNSCTLGQERCSATDNYQHQVCNVQGIWETTPCTASQQCEISSGRCVSSGQCTKGEEQCLTAEPSGHMVCNEQGQWVEQPCASEELCSPKTGECTMPLCLKDEERCEANQTSPKRGRCAADRLSFESADCPPNTICVQQGTKTNCEDVICTPGQIRCGPALLEIQTCDTNGTHWTTTTECPFQHYCIDDGTQIECRKAICAEGTTRCRADEKSLEQCINKGTEWKVVNCQQDSLCLDEPNVGKASCKPIICETDKYRCSLDHTAIEICSNRGTEWKLSQECASQDSCANNNCITATAALGEVVTLPANSTTPEINLTPGRYAIAVVNTDTENSSQFSMPVQVTGEVISSTMASQLPTLSQTATNGLYWQCLTPQIIQQQSIVPTTWRSNDLIPDYLPPLPYTIGDIRLFYLIEDNTKVERKGTLRATSQQFQIWEDTTNTPVNTIINSDILENLKQRLEAGVFPRVTTIFGNPTDVDKNDRVDIFYTNYLPASAVAFINPYNIYPPGASSQSYDFGEIIYSSGPNAKLHHGADFLAHVIAHELHHLIYYGQRLRPYLDPVQSPPDWFFAEIYAAEGMANVSAAWAGQSILDHPHDALESPEEWSLARMLSPKYQIDQTANLSSYGHGTMLMGYLFDQSGGVTITGSSTVVDGGGINFANQFTDVPSGIARFSLKDGRGLDKSYVDMGAALLLTTLEEKQLSTNTIQNKFYHFAPVVKDPVYGGELGIPLRHEDYSEGTGSILKRTPWAQRKELRRGGMAFLDLNVGDQGAKLTVTDAHTAIILLRYKSL